MAQGDYLSSIVEILTRIGREQGSAMDRAAEAVDSTGAGDTFNAVLAVRLSEGETLREACVAANAAAARSVMVKYVIPSLPKRS